MAPADQYGARRTVNNHLRNSFTEFNDHQNPSSYDIPVLTTPVAAPTTLPPPKELTFSPEQMAHYEETVAFERIVGITIPTIFAFVIFIGLIGNVLVIMVIATNRQMQNTTNTLIINLAMSDLLFLSFCVPFTAADYALPIWAFSRGWCKVMNYLQSVSAYASVWTLVLMAFDRFLAVVFPVQSMSLRTVKKACIVLAMLWIIILLSNLPHIWEAEVHHYRFVKEQRSVCAFLKHASGLGNESDVQAYYYSFNAFGYVVPLSITLGLYAGMLRRLWVRRPGSQVTAPKKVSSESMKNKRRVTILVTAVTGVFAICWLPLNICFFVTAFKYRQKASSGLTKPFFVFQVVAQVLAYTNSCLNPILYAFLSENFRKGFYRLVFSCRRCASLEWDETTRRFVTNQTRLDYEFHSRTCRPSIETAEQQYKILKQPKRSSRASKGRSDSRIEVAFKDNGNTPGVHFLSPESAKDQESTTSLITTQKNDTNS